MPDISMCGDDECPSRMQCWRFMATPSFRQSFTCYDRSPDDERCGSFWPMKKEEA